MLTLLPLILSLPLIIAQNTSTTNVTTTSATTQPLQIQWHNCSDPQRIPAPVAATNLSIPASSFPATLWCGSLLVPMDYNNSTIEGNQIELGFAMYRPPNPIGLLNFNPGGPGQEVASKAWEIAFNISEGLFFEPLLGYDILAMDPRGIGQTNPLNCSVEAFGGPVLPYVPSTQESYDNYTSRIIPFADSCIANTKPQGFIEHVGTNEVIRDWDCLRAALGYEKMSMLHQSYGTFQAEYYATTFPDKLDKAVLDGVYPRGITPQDYMNSEISNANKLLYRADAFCMNDTGCPFHAQGKGAVINAYTSVLTSLNSTTNSSVTTADLQAMTILAYFTLNPDFISFNQALALATQGNYTFFDYSNMLQELYTVGVLEILPLACADLQFPHMTFDQAQSITANISSQGPLHAGLTDVFTLYVLCSKWPFTPSLNTTDASTNLPIVLVTSEFDQNTPYEHAVLMYNKSPNSTLVVRKGDGHGTIGALSTYGPAYDAVAQYLVQGVVPASFNPNLLTTYPPGRGQPGNTSDPYAVPVGILAGDLNDTSSSAAGNGSSGAGQASGAVGRYDCLGREIGVAIGFAGVAISWLLI